LGPLVGAARLERSMVPLSETLRLFPLAEVVHFPDTNLPLLIFEPRYRRMLEDALASDKVIAMVLLRGGQERSPEGDKEVPSLPTVYSVGCAGRVTEHQRLPDGRSTFVLRGAAKFRIEQELSAPDSARPYRMVKALALYEAPVTPEQSKAWAADLRLRVDRLVVLLGGDSSGVDKLFHAIPEAELLNVLSATLPFSVVEKQGLLECPTPEARMEALLRLFDFREAEARLGLDSSRRVDA
jgi:Lon protease-like protein